MKSDHRVPLLCCVVAWFCCAVVECHGGLLDADGNAWKEGNSTDEDRLENGAVNAANIRNGLPVTSYPGVILTDTGDEDAKKIPEEVCQSDFPKCIDTGGNCTVKVEEESEKSAIECECPGKSLYEVGEGCTVSDEVCTHDFPKCKDTNGNCNVKVGNEKEESEIQCECAVQRAYKENEGCKECECGINGKGCSFFGDFKNCTCVPNSAQKEDKCIDCNCGKGSIGCKFTKRGNKVCKCNEKFAQKEEICEVKDDVCKSNFPKCIDMGGHCIAIDGEDNEQFKIQCECPEKSVFEEGQGCIVPEEVCRSDFPKCKDTGGNCNVNVDTDYVDPYIECKCPEKSLYVAGKGCEECDCGEFSDGCGFVKGEKKCKCRHYFAQKNGVCTECKCGDQSYGCVFENDEKKCLCPWIYVQENGICTECNCGTDSFGCAFENGEKKCKCYKGYVQQNGGCTVCDCGVHSKQCRLEEGEKICECDEAYAVNNGICTVCSCGPPSAVAGCHFENDEKICECRLGFGSKDGWCEFDQCYQMCGVVPGKEHGEVECKGDRFGSVSCICLDDSKKFDPDIRICRFDCKEMCGHDSDVTCELQGNQTVCLCNDGRQFDYITKECPSKVTETELAVYVAAGLVACVAVVLKIMNIYYNKNKPRGNEFNME